MESKQYFYSENQFKKKHVRRWIKEHMGFENGHRRVAMQIGIMYVGPRHNWYRTVRLVIAATIISEFPLLPTAM